MTDWRHLRAGAVIFVALAACDAKAPRTGDASAAASASPAPSSTYSSLTGHFDYAVPAAWSTSVRIVEEPGASAVGTWPLVQHAVHFVYQPSGAGARQETVLSILAYADAAFDRAARSSKPLAGIEVARANGRVFAALVSSKNPYAAGAPDHDRFATLQPALDAVKGALTPR